MNLVKLSEPWSTKENIFVLSTRSLYEIVTFDKDVKINVVESEEYESVCSPDAQGNLIVRF